MMKEFALLKIATISNKRVKKFDGIKHYVATADINLNQIVGGEQVSYDNRPSRADLVMGKDDVLFAKMKNTIKVLSGSSDIESKIFSTGFYIITPNESINKKYLYFYLISDYFNKQKDSYCTGATMSAIGNAGLGKIKIFIPVDTNGNPDIKEQERIVTLLEEAENLKKKRLEADKKKEELIPAIFNEMFGDPINNPMGWSVSSLETLMDKKRKIKCGPFGSALKRNEYVKEGIPVWGIPNMLPNVFKEEGSLFITDSKFNNLMSYSVESGDLLVSRAGTVGMVCVARPTKEKSIIGTNLIRLSLNQEKILPEFASVLINQLGSMSGKLRVNSDEGAYSFMSTKGLAKLNIYIPPIKLQEIFVKKVKTMESLKEKQEKSSEFIDSMFSSILSKTLENHV